MVKKPGSAPRVLVDDAHLARYIGNSVLVYQRNRALMATHLNLETLTTTGPGVMLFDDLSPAAPSWAAGGGVLVYRPRNDNRRLVWVRRDGTEVSLPRSTEAIRGAEPFAERRWSCDRNRGGGLLRDIWTIDVERQRLSKLTSDGASRYPMWTPDGRYVGVVQRRENTLYLTAPGEGQRHELVNAKLPIWIGSWSPGMRTLIYMLESPVTGPDLWAVNLQTNAARPLVQTAAHEYRRTGVVGWQVARVFLERNRSIRPVLRPLARNAPRYRISTTNERALASAREAVWSRDGRELFYRHG